MGASRSKTRGSITSYGEKTSDNGYWDIGGQYGGTNSNGSKWTSTNWQWVEQAAAQPAPAAAPQASSGYASSSANFASQLASIKAQNQASMNALTKQLADQKTDYDAREAASNKKISGLASTVANAQSQYDPMSDMGSSNNINPALTIQEKDKSLSSGTQRYNRSKLSINNLNV
jgi:hypothetical protein